MSHQFLSRRTSMDELLSFCKICNTCSFLLFVFVFGFADRGNNSQPAKRVIYVMRCFKKQFIL